MNDADHREILRTLFPKSLPWRIARLHEALRGLFFWWLPKDK